MKTQKKVSKLAKLAATISMPLLMVAACGGNQKNAADASDQITEEIKVKPPTMDLHTATFMGDLKVIQQHIAAGSDLDIQEPTLGSSPLISAAVFGKTEVARALIEGGANVNLQNNDGSTALHSAAFLCRTEIVQMLLDHGADKSLKNNAGSTALESVSIPFSDVKFIYDIFSKDLGPLGLKLDYAEIESTRPRIAEMLRNH